MDNISSFSNLFVLNFYDHKKTRILLTNTQGNNQPKLQNQILMIQPTHPYQAQSTKAINTEQALKAIKGPKSTNGTPFHEKAFLD